MRMVQKNKEETASLPVWLRRDGPHERELARETLDQMGREKLLDYLLHLHYKEETRRQKRLALLKGYIFCLVALIVLLLGTVICFGLIAPRPVVFNWLSRAVPLMMICVMAVQLITFLSTSKAGRKTPMLSSVAQQDLITALLDYSDSPRAADALCRASSYYAGDQNRLYYRLTYALSRLPNDPAVLTEPACRALTARLSCLPLGFEGETESLPVLQAAIICYFARTGKPSSRSLTDLFWALRA